MTYQVVCLFYSIKKKGVQVKFRDNRNIIKPRSAFKRLFVDLPKQMINDRLAFDPDDFQEGGLHMIVGKQGSGKTITAVQMMMELARKYPKLIVRTNMSYKYQNERLTNWQQLIGNSNGIYGQVEMIDEIQTWWSSKDSGNLPPEMLGNISQQRKQKKMLLGTAQVYSRISKEIREQVKKVYCPMTIFRCLTIVRITEPEFWNQDKQIFTKYKKTYFFVHSPTLREAYDTYECIQRYAESGFNERPITAFDMSLFDKNKG